ncbi:DUF2062 domain-containing protein [Alienimonas sp. DA493]|uniref:DUF2062 domain-containing protein n=1 Tax=Alienimonas sp. DA493 TaxID=3373605 RepID=UPI003754FC2C
MLMTAPAPRPAAGSRDDRSAPSPAGAATIEPPPDSAGEAHHPPPPIPPGEIHPPERWIPDEHAPPVAADDPPDDDAPAGQKLQWWSSPRTLLNYVLGLEDTPHQIALGVAVGFFWGMTPTVGVQMMLVLAFYYCCKPFFNFNVKASLVTVYISNPLTMLAIYWFDYEVGTLFVSGDLTKAELAGVLEYEGLADWWETVKDLVLRVGWPMLIGSVVVGGACALASYPITRWSVVKWRSRKA